MRSAARSPTGRLVALARGRSASIGDVQVHDGHSYQVAPLGPGTVVVADFFVTEQILQDKPGVGAALADTAVGDGFIGASDALGLIQGLQLIEGLERAVVVGGLPQGMLTAPGMCPARRAVSESPGGARIFPVNSSTERTSTSWARRRFC